MSKRIRAAVLRSAALLLLLMTCRAALAAAPQVVTIAGHPLTLYIGDDASLQTVNAQVPGTGQFYPSDSADSTPHTADARRFVAVGGQLYGPHFETHPDATPTNSPGAERTQERTYRKVSPSNSNSGSTQAQSK